MFWILFFIIRLNNSCNSHWMYDKQKTLYCTLEFDFIRTVTVWFTIYMTGRKSQWLGGRHSWHFSDHHCLLLHHLCWVVSLQNHFQKNLEELIHICVLDHRSVHHQNWNVYTDLFSASRKSCKNLWLLSPTYFRVLGATMSAKYRSHRSICDIWVVLGFIWGVLGASRRPFNFG